MLFKNSLHPWCVAVWVCNKAQCTMHQFRRQPFLNYVYILAHIVTFEKKIEENISFRFSKSVLRITFCEFSAVGTLSEQTNCYHSTAKTDTDGQDANLPFVNGRCYLE